jgi:plasmid maintenance system killer protein
MKVTFATKQLEDWFTGEYSGKQPFSGPVLKAYQKAINKLIAAPSTVDLRVNKSLDFHPLTRELSGKYAIRVNMQYRVVFSINKETNQVDIIDVEQLTDYH